MDLIHAFSSTLASPMVLAFLLGVGARLLRSDLRLPEALYSALTIYLLFAIGLKGGAKLDGVSWNQFLPAAGAALLLCLVIPVWSFGLLTRAAGLSTADAGAIAAHYGSVSAVTFGASLAFLESAHVTTEPFMPALLALMEGPGILVALVLVRLSAPTATASLARSPASVGFVAGGEWGTVLTELLTSKGVILLVGGLAIGLVTGHAGFEQVAPLFESPFKGALTLFLLELGLVTGSRLADLRRAGPRLVAFGLIMPLFHGFVGAWLGRQAGLGVGGSTVLATLAASASYIAAPAAVRLALPEANPAYYLTASLAVTFPFNVLFGIPIYHLMARFWAGG